MSHNVPNENLYLDAAEKLEWEKVTHALANCAVLKSTQENLRNITYQVEAQDREYLFNLTEEYQNIFSREKIDFLVPFDPELFVPLIKIGALLSPLALWHLYLLCLSLESSQKFLKNITNAGLAGRYPHILELLKPAQTIYPLQNRLQMSVDEDGNLLSSASAELRSLRQKLDNAKRRMEEHLQSMLRRAGVRDALQDNVWMMRDGRYVLPVRTDRKGDIAGIPHGVSASGATIFIEPAELAETQHIIEQATADVLIEEARILRELAALAFDNRQALLEGLNLLEFFDMVQARSQFAAHLQGVRPRFHQDKSKHGSFEFFGARHPLFLLEKKPCVANDLILKQSVWVISGPNAGGKTVAMKTAGLLTAMALAGLYVPAEAALLFEFRKVIVEMGDRQNISDDLSTFSGHLTQVNKMLAQANTECLILMDEGFVGTDPTIGVALARATLEFLANSGASVLITTHFSGLKMLADTDPRFFNASMEFEPTHLRPTYKLQQGVPGQSFAIELAERLGLPRDLLATARGYIGEEMLRVEKLLAQLAQQREELEKQISQQKQLNTTLDQEREKLTKQRQQVETLQSEIVDRYKSRMEKRFNSFENKLEIRERQFEKAKRDLLREIEERQIKPAAQGTEITEAQTQALRPKPALGAKQPEILPTISAAKNAGSEKLETFEALAQFRFPSSSQTKNTEKQLDLAAAKLKLKPSNKMTTRDYLDEARSYLDELRLEFCDDEEELEMAVEEVKEKIQVPHTPPPPRPIGSTKTKEFWQIGMQVRSDKFNQTGEVLREADSKGLVECKFGMIKAKLHFSELHTLQEKLGQKLTPKPATAEKVRSQHTLQKSSLRPATQPLQNAHSSRNSAAPAGTRSNKMNMNLDTVLPHKGNTLDLRGALVDTAIDRLEEFIDRAIVHGNNSLVVIHGHGTGRVKQGVREYLGSSRHNLIWRPGTAGEGSDGVTVILLQE